MCNRNPHPYPWKTPGLPVALWQSLGELNSQSELGDDDNEDEKEEGKDDKSEFVVIDAVIVVNLS